MEMAAGIIVLLLVLIVLISFVYLIGRFFFSKKQRGESINLSMDRKDAVGQILILLGVLFFGETLLLLNRNLSGSLPPLWIVFITLLFSFYAAYSTESLYPALFGVIFFPVWWISQSLAWVETANIRSNAVLSGAFFTILFFYLSGKALETKEKWKEYGVIIRITSLAMLSSFFLIISTPPFGMAFLEEIGGGGAIFRSFPLTFFLTLFFLANLRLLGLPALSGRQKSLSSVETGPLLFFLFLFFVFVFIRMPALSSGGYDELTRSGIAWTVILILLTFSQMFWLLFLGYYKKERFLVNLGVFFLFIFIAIQYFSHFRFLNKSLFFLLGGILLLVIGYLMEKSRKFYLGKISNPKV